MNRIWLIVFIVPLLASLGAQEKAKVPSMAEARAAAEANGQTPEGVQYNNQLGTYFMQNHGRDFDSCREKMRTSERGFEILLMLDKNGNAIQLLASPSKKLAQCIRAAILKAKFPIPPRPEYWASLHIGTGGCRCRKNGDQ